MKTMESGNDTFAKTEVHSEKVRKLLEEMPRSLTLWGTVVIVAVAIGLISALCLLPYPYSDGESILIHLLTHQSNKPF